MRSYKRSWIQSEWQTVIGDTTFMFTRFENCREVVTYVYKRVFEEVDYPDGRWDRIHYFIWPKSNGD